jgi:hypothetical protein
VSFPAREWSARHELTSAPLGASPHRSQTHVLFRSRITRSTRSEQHAGDVNVAVEARTVKRRPPVLHGAEGGCGTLINQGNVSQLQEHLKVRRREDRGQQT